MAMVGGKMQDGKACVGNEHDNFLATASPAHVLRPPTPARRAQNGGGGVGEVKRLLHSPSPASSPDR